MVVRAMRAQTVGVFDNRRRGTGISSGVGGTGELLCGVESDATICRWYCDARLSISDC